MEKKEISMEARLLLAFLLMGLVLFGTQYFYKPPPQPANKTAQTAKDKTAATTAPSQAAIAQAESPKAAASSKETHAAEMPGEIHSDKEETFTIETERHKVQFSNRGAVVKSWILKGYKDHKGNPLDLVNTPSLEAAGNKTVPLPFSLVFKNQPPQTDPNNALFRAERTPDGYGVDFEFSDGHALTKKSFRFFPDTYLVDVTTEVTENGVRVPHSVAWRGGFGDQTVFAPVAEEHALFYDIGSNKLSVKELKEAKNGPVSTSGLYSFAGLEDKYFAGVFLPRNKSNIDLTVLDDTLPSSSGADQQRIGAAVGGDGLNTFQFFAGPKDVKLLREVDPKLTGLIDWGWFEVIAKPLFFVLQWTATNVVHNYGWAIVLVTVALNLLQYPLRISSMKSAKKMQSLQPQIAAINAKYKNISLRDPKKADQNQEIMELYKREGVNPMGGCLPMVLQIPLAYAFYKVLSVAIDLRGANWLWVRDLSQAESLPIHILPIILVITQFMQQKMTPTPGSDPSQQRIMMFMPLMFGYIFYSMSAGLVLYWLTGNLVGIGQQWLLNRMTKPATPAVVDVKPTPRKKR